MDNLNMLCQTIRYQRTALQNSQAMISTVQQHGEKLLKRTLEQSPWIPGEGRDTCLFWAGLWTKNLTEMTDLVDKNLATMERLTSTGEKRKAGQAKPTEKPATEPAEKPATEPTGTAAAIDSNQEGKPREERRKISDRRRKEMEAAIAKTELQTALASDQPQEKKPEQP